MSQDENMQTGLEAISAAYNVTLEEAAELLREQMDQVLAPMFSEALLREMIQEEEEHIRSLDYLVTRHRTRLAWLRAVQRGTIRP